VDVGKGRPVVLVPGIQGRWELMEPAVRALAKRCRVLTFSLSGERSAAWPFDRELGFGSFLGQIDHVLERAGLSEATVCGVSYGGLIAVHYAAARAGRVSALILVSTPGPGWEPTAAEARYARAPLLYAPLFLLRSPLRLYPEIASAYPQAERRIRFTLRQLLRVAVFRVSPRLMGQRIGALAGVDFARDASRIAVPTLLITGEPGLDRVVPVDGTLRYGELIPGAEAAILEKTGHLGVITRPDEFADLVCDFMERRVERESGKERDRW
jgi:pimeloyl-ACP methyl ester carboxylesterase